MAPIIGVEPIGTGLEDLSVHPAQWAFCDPCESLFGK